jgi:hypothetical protein
MRDKIIAEQIAKQRREQLQFDNKLELQRHEQLLRRPRVLSTQQHRFRPENFAVNPQIGSQNHSTQVNPRGLVQILRQQEQQEQLKMALVFCYNYHYMGDLYYFWIT